jgi:selenocysteine-specific elongation factor
VPETEGRTHVVGTAGHVDHGKSTLVHALTGIHPDRLREEVEREMTIDLGFAWLTLPQGEAVGIVDVPGHRDFIENMLAGVGGMDAVMLVVAADEGVMPQTREHAAILRLLGIERGILVLSKADLADDPEWLRLVESEARALLAGTPLAESRVVPVSARTGQGVPELVQALASLLRDLPHRADRGRPRLPIDRVFTMPGFGTVVTGTLLDGRLELGQEVELSPSGMRGRVRGLQTHKRKIELALPGSRVAVNLSGVGAESVARGEVLTLPGAYPATRLIDVRVDCLADASAPITHNQELKLFIGTAQRVARIRLLGGERLRPGESGWAQLVLRRAVTALAGDRLVVRRPSPGETLGGGVVVETAPARLHRRQDAHILATLERLAQGDPRERLVERAAAEGPATAQQLAAAANLDTDSAAAMLEDLIGGGRMRRLGAAAPAAERLLVESNSWKQLTDRARSVVQEYHRAFPLRPGVPREELKSRLGLQGRAFLACLHTWCAEGLMRESSGCVALLDYRPAPSASQQAAIDRVMAQVVAAGSSPPTVKELTDALGAEVYAYLVTSGALVSVSPEVAFGAAAYRTLVSGVRQLLAREGQATVARLRDEFGTSRKYVLALLEHLDAKGITVRDGDFRRLGPGAGVG